MKPVVALVCSEPLRACMAGSAVRHTELARALAEAGLVVRLLAPRVEVSDYAAPDDVTVLTLLPQELAVQLADVDVVIVQGHTAEWVLRLDLAAKIVVDFYDPYLIENASYFEQLGPEVFANDLRTWRALCTRGDYFLCASEAQRLFYTGFLLSEGRINAQQLAHDPNLESLFGIVPFGVSSAIAEYTPYLPPKAPTTTRLLFGGLYDWYDPFTLLEALNSPEFAQCELILVRNVNPESTPQKRLGEVLAWCEQKEWPATRLNIIDWVPYTHRFDLLRDVDALVATHATTFETSLSMRTRFFDAIAVGCPVIGSTGGMAAELISEYHAGHVVAAGNVPALRSAIRAVMGNGAKSRVPTNKNENHIDRFRELFAWPEVVAPLTRYIQRVASNPDINDEYPRHGGVLFSVLLPTFNRMDVLPEVVAALEAQSNAPNFELIIVNDGSSDATQAWLDSYAFGLPVTVIHQDNAGPAAARNAAINAALGDYLVLLGDDTVPEHHWLNAHYSAHQQRNFSKSLIVVGRTDWHAAIRHTPLLRYLDSTAWQFAFDQINDLEHLPFNYFYGSNVSLPRALVANERFSAAFPYPAWEDSELGYRLVNHGARLVFAPGARTAHLHPTNVARFAARQRKAGYCAMVFTQLHPEAGPLVANNIVRAPSVPLAWRARMRRWLASALEPMSNLMGVSTPALWEQVLSEHYAAGIADYLSEHSQTLQSLNALQVLPITYTARSPILQHHTGELHESDIVPRWQCLTAQHAAGHCVYGPNYCPSEQQSLCVDFMLELLGSCGDSRTSAQDDQAAVTIDVYDNRSDRILAEEVLSSRALATSAVHSLRFISTVDQQLEFRVYWHAKCDIAVGSIVLSRVNNDH